MNSLAEFFGEFRDGFQYNNRFLCQITPPTALAATLTNEEQIALGWIKRGIACESTHLPDRAFGETPMGLYGITEQFPYHTDYTSIDCVFMTPMLGTNNILPRVFAAWQNLVQDMRNGYESSRDFTFPDTYYSQVMSITTFNRQNVPSLTYTFERVYPQLVQSVPLSWEEVNELTNLTVKFTFSAWKVEPANYNGPDPNEFRETPFVNPLPFFNINVAVRPKW